MSRISPLFSLRFEGSTAVRVVRTVSAAVMLAAGTGIAGAQSVTPLPNTATTVAGGGAAIAAGATCPANAQYKAADASGNGCPGTNANFSAAATTADLRGGIASDGQGNIYIADSGEAQIRKYDPKTGVLSKMAGKGTNCAFVSGGTGAGALDSSGDGCLATSTSFASTPRGIGSDPYGNVLFAGYGTQMVHVICETASPLCPNTSGRKQIGYMYRVAGCVAGSATTTTAATAGSGFTAGSEGDGTVASPFQNLSGDVAQWGAGVTGTGSCSAAVGEVNQPRGVAGDKWGNVYIGETALGRYRIVLGPKTSSYFSGTNPMYALVQMNPAYPTAKEGFIYPLMDGFSAQTSGGITYAIPGASGAACQTGTGASSATATDAFGDGCQYFATAVNANTSSIQGIAVDGYGNIVITDALTSLLRVIYAGGANAAANPMYAAIVANNPSVTPTQGFIYRLAGGASSGSTFSSATPALGSSVILSNGIYKIAVGANNVIYLGDTSNTQALMFDVNTGYIRSLFKSNSAVCAAHVTGSSTGDGCPANGFSFSTSNGFGVAPDALGNLYVLDQNFYLRKVEAVSLIPTTVGSTTASSAPLTQTMVFHGPAGTASMTATLLNGASDVTLGTVTCAAANGDTTMDCSVPVTFAPTAPGPRTANLSVSMLNASSAVIASQVFPVQGTGIASALVADVAAPSTTSVSTTHGGTVAVDGTGNVYSIDSSDGLVHKNASAIAGATAPTNPIQMSVDAAGNFYITSSGAATITKGTLGVGGAYAMSTLSYSAITLPQAAVVDGQGNLYVADKSTGQVFEVTAAPGTGTPQVSVLAAGFTNPVGLAFDGSGNLFVDDQSNGVYKVAFVNGVATVSAYAANGSINVTATPGATATSSSPTVTISGLVAASVAADAGGNVYVQNSTTKNVLAIPVTQAGLAYSTVSLPTTSLPNGLAVDGTGAVYISDSGNHTLTKVNRNAAVYDFGTNTTTVASAVITNAGNLTATGYQSSLLDSAEFPITSVSPTNCYATASILPGYPCSVTTQFTPGSGTGTVQSVETFTVATSTTGTLTFKGTKNGAAVTTTTTIGTQTPASPIYAASGTEVTFPVSVVASDSSTVSGTVNITVDSNTPYAVTVTNGVASAPLSGLAAGSHTITAQYPTQAGITGSTSSTVSFTVAQATTTTSWTPGATTQQFSAAVGNSVLNASAVVTGSSTAAPGYYLYTATPTGGSAQTIHAASYLPIGTYTLAVTFVPTDSVDYVGSTATVANYTVTKASTAAPIGVTKMLVASDGTGNYTSVQSAVNALGTAGGSVYIKPGTYTGDVTVVQPNVSLRGLGGDPTAVVLTHSGGAFGASSGVQAYAGEFTAAMMNGSQLPSGSTVFIGDPGSATLVVSKGINTAISSSTLTPNGFYGENFSVVNTYDSDNTTTTTTYVSNGNCTANAGAAQTYFALYNAGILCASQALAIYSTSDLAVMNNLYATSLQDTLCFGSCGSTALGYPSRLYWFRGKVTGNVDYIFGDGAVAFDYASIFSAQNKSGGTSGGTIHAQSKNTQIGASNDYISGFVMNSNVFTSQTNNTYVNLGRPYGTYSTFLALNSYFDEVLPGGYVEFSGKTNLPSSTFGEYNDMVAATPATGAADLNGVIYNGSATWTGYGVLSTSTPPAARETTSLSPGTPMANNAVHTAVTAAQATLYYPTAFLGTTVSSTYSTTANFNPTSTLAANVNAFVPSTSSVTLTYGDSVTVLVRPSTPGLGAITNGVYTVPTGTYVIKDGTTTIASGTLDASGEAYFTTSTLAIGSHSLTWTYGGDSNFSGSTTSSAISVVVNGQPTTTTLSVSANPIVYGASTTVTATVSPQSGTATPTGNVTPTLDGTASTSQALSGGQTMFTLSGLQAGSHSFTGTYGGSTVFSGSTSTALGLTVSQASLTATGSCANRTYGAANVCSANVTGYQYTDSASTVFTGTPTGTTTTSRLAPAGTYSATADGSSLGLTTFGAKNYTVTTAAATSFTVSGGAAQAIVFLPLPQFSPGNTYELTATATSGLPVSYSIVVGGGIASISGSTITVSGSGTIQIQATCTDASGNYAAAPAVSQSTVSQ